MDSPATDGGAGERGETYLPRDFVETAEGLLFAVVAHGLEAGRVLCFLRLRALRWGTSEGADRRGK